MFCNAASSHRADIYVCTTDGVKPAAAHARRFLGFDTPSMAFEPQRSQLSNRGLPCHCIIEN